MSHSRKTLLIIDDDKLFSDSAAAFFHGEGVHVATAGSGAQGLAWCRKNRVDVILLDQRLPDCSGNELCHELLEFNEQAKIIFITAYPSFDNAIQALRNGAWDYLSKPMELEELKLAVNNGFRTVDLEHVEQVQKFHYQKDSAKNCLLGTNGGLASIADLLERAAANRAPVLITGETGTGKTVVAKTIHYLHHARQRPFIDINCAALPENLIESELFGYEKGAFTDAGARKKGLFEMADGGTLFLDEIGELPPGLQSKLLGVLDSGTFRRLGGQTECTTDVRIIAATNVDLESAIDHKQFRQDLYYRLSVLRIHLPPLRNRKQDIGELVHHFLATISPDMSLTIPEAELEMLGRYPWPGNVRELKNIIERAIILRNDDSILPSKLLAGDLASSVPESARPSENKDKILTLAEVERHQINHALTLYDGNRTHAAKALGVARSTLLRKIEQLGL